MSKLLTYANAVRYDGANGAAVAAAVGGTTYVITETGGVLTLDSCGTVVVATGSWVRYAGGCVAAVYTQSALDLLYVTDGQLTADAVAAQASVDSLTITVSTLAAAVTGLAAAPRLTGVGVTTTPALLLGASTTLQVTLEPAQVSTAYAVTPRLVGAVSQLAVTGVTVISTTRVDVTVQATLAHGGGGQVLVLAR